MKRYMATFCSLRHLGLCLAAVALMIVGTRLSTVHSQGGCPAGPFLLTPTNAAVPATGGNGNVAWTINPANTCASQSASLDSFVALIPPAQFPTGVGNVNYVVGPNTTLAARVGRIRISNANAYSGTVFNVNQALAPLAQGLSLSAASLSFTFTQGAAAAAVQNVNLLSTSGILNFSATATTGWLSVAPAMGATPAVLRISVNPAGLAPGDYVGAVNINAPGATPPTVIIGVVLRVKAANPALAVDQPALTFNVTSANLVSNRRLTVRNSGGGQLTFTASATTQVGSWLSLSATGGTATDTTPVSLLVTADGAGLNAGTYTGTISIRAGTGESFDINVTLSIAASPSLLALSPTGLTFQAIAGGPAPPAQTFAVINQSVGSFNWTASTSTVSGGPGLLSATPANGTSTDLNSPFVTVRVNPAGLAAGDYYGQVEIAAAGVPNSPQSVLVVLSIAAPTAAPSANVGPTGLIFVGDPARPNVASQNVVISNTGLQPLTFIASASFFSGPNWFTFQPANGMIASGQTAQVVLQPTLAGLAVGTYPAELRIQIVGENGPRRISLLLVLAPGAITTTATRTAGGCVPTRLLPVFTLLGQDFMTPAAWPTPIQLRVVDDCGDPMRQGSLTVSFSNGDPPLALLSLRDGRWSGTWPARNTRNSQISIEAQAQTSNPDIAGTAGIGGSVQPNPGVPLIAGGGIFNSASFAPNTALAPGSFITIFGAGLATGAAVAESLPLPTSLGGTQGIISGRLIPLFFASDGQLNAVLPSDLAPNVPHQLLLRRGTAVSAPESVVIAEAQPGVFTRDQSGTGQAVVVAVRADNSQFFPEPGTPASAGNVLVIYCTGLGVVNPAIRAGEAAPFDVLSSTVRPVTVTIGGVSAAVAFAGLTPGFTGLYQVNVAVPAGVAPGDAVPLVLTEANQSSRVVTIAVR